MARLEPDSDFLKGSCEPPANRSLRKLVKNVIPGLHHDPQTAHGHHLPAYHAFHRGRREPAGLAPNLCETRFYAKECFDGPARPGCRLCPVRAVIRNCPVLENSSCQMTKDLYLTCQHRPPGSLPKTHATGPHHRCRNPERGHGPP